MELLKKLYNIYSPSYGEDKMVKFLKGYCRKLGGKVTIDKNNNIFITKGLSDSYPCVVAHTDQVSNHHHSKDFRVIREGDILYGYSQKNHRKEGLGADDKNGIWVALKCLEKYKKIKVALFTEEEVGCGGSSSCDKSFFKDCRFVLQCDRRNADDLIVNICGDLCSDEFITDINYEKFGYKMTDGLCTDVEELRSDIPISMVNMSCGYYKPHTDEEYTKFSELQNCLDFVCYIIENCTKVYEFPLKASNTLFKDKYEGLYSNKGWYDYYDMIDSKGDLGVYDDYYEDNDLAFLLYDEIINNTSDTPVEPFDIYTMVESDISPTQMEEAFIIALSLAARKKGKDESFRKMYKDYYDEVFASLKKYAGDNEVKNCGGALKYEFTIGEGHVMFLLFTDDMSALIVYKDYNETKTVSSMFSSFQFVRNMQYYGTPIFDDDIVDIAETECKYLDLSQYNYDDVTVDNVKVV